MPQLLLLAACAALSALLASADHAANVKKAASVGIFMDFESAPGEESVRTMEAEVNALLKPSGLSLDWQFLRDNRGRQPFAGLVVLKFKGACKAGAAFMDPAADGEGEEALGSTAVDHGRVLPYTEVECDRVRKALAYLGPGAGQKERQRALGVAMAHVVAHELYHILASTTSHTGKGIAKASHSLDDLLFTGRLEFSPADSLAMANSVVGK